MEKIITYELSELDEEWRRIVESIWFFKTQEIAEQVKKNAFQTIDKREIKIYESLEDFNTEKDKEIKKNILKKLSPDEIRVLNLT